MKPQNVISRLVAAFLLIAYIVSQFKLHASMPARLDHPSKFEALEQFVINNTWDQSYGRQEQLKATFRGIQLSYVHENRPSMVHCAGENFLENTWVYKSCQFRHLCYDLDQKEFILFESLSQKEANFPSNMSPYARSASHFNQTVSTSGVTPQSIRKGKHKWFPQTVPLDQQGYYEIKNAVWIPFHVTFARSMSRLLGDVLFPIYNLLSIFGMEGRDLILHPFDQDCEHSDNASSTSECLDNVLRTVLPMLQLASNHSTSFLRPLFQTNGKRLSNRICARHAVAGIGSLTDHGTKSHGEKAVDYTFAQNTGRGPLFSRFRDYVLRNLDIGRLEKYGDQLVTFAMSNKSPNFLKQIQVLRGEIPVGQLTVQEIDISSLPFRELIELATRTTFYVSRMGDDAWPGLFLTRGSTLILYYNDVDEFVKGGKGITARPIMRDWDWWNNLSHITVHWLPVKTKDNEQDVEVFVRLIQNEIGYLKDLEVLNQRDSTISEGVTAGSLNGMDLTYVNRSQPSAVHCLGDNFVAREAFAYRSCEIQHLCLDLGRSPAKFLVSPSKQQLDLNHSLAQWDQEYSVVSTDMNKGVLEGRVARFAEESWFPVLVNVSHDYYLLPSDVVLIPYAAEDSYASNPGHLLWDFFLPFYNLLSMYDLEGKRVLPISIDMACLWRSDCRKIVTKFLPLIGVNGFQHTYKLSFQTNGKRPTNRVCSRYGVAGFGMLTDHGFTRHGQNLVDYQRVHNAGRGAVLYGFRGFMLKRMGIAERVLKRPRQITISINSSNKETRRKDFARQQSALRNAFATDEARVAALELARLNLGEQVQLVVDTSIFLSVVGGSTSMATFLPRGASLVLFFSDIDSFVGRTRKKDFPTMMDFDLWNNAAYIRVHWLPIKTMDTDTDLKYLVRLIQNELHTMDMVTH